MERVSEGVNVLKEMAIEMGKVNTWYNCYCYNGCLLLLLLFVIVDDSNYYYSIVIIIINDRNDNDTDDNNQSITIGNWSTRSDDGGIRP